MSALNLRNSLLLAGSLLGAALAPLGSSSIAVAIPLIAESLESDPAIVMRLLVGGYLFISVVGQVPGGRLADRYGALPILSAGLVIYVLGCVLGFLVANLATLTVSRMAMALGTALIGPATGALIRIQIPSSRLPFAFGIFGTTMSAAAASGPWIGGLVVSQQHWSWVFAINLPLAALSALLIYLSIDKKVVQGASPEQSADAGFDWRSILILAVAVLCLQAGLAYKNLFVLVAAMIAFYLFYHFEQRTKHPIIHSSLYKNRTFLNCCVITGLNNFTMYAVMFQVPVLLIVLGITDPLRAGTVLLAMTIAMMICGPVSGAIAASVGHRLTLVAAQSTGFLGLVSLISFTPVYGEAAVIPSITLLGISVGLTMPLIQATAIGSVPKSEAGTATGGSSTARYIGGALGIATMSMVLTGGNELSSHLDMIYVYMVVFVLMLAFVLMLPRHQEAVD